MTPDHQRVYSAAQCYDVAFNSRDIAAECDTPARLAVRTDWVAEDQGRRAHTCWGAPGDAFDPITQIAEGTVTMACSGPAGDGRVVEQARQRRFTANEVDALVRASGQFEIVEWLGSLVTQAAFTNERTAPFMVPVLRQKPGAARGAVLPTQRQTDPRLG